ncbi:rhomboid family intramembrane serine protease [Rossellomorea aquimaris]|uniref:rhomboid family intramembrane serine protease n=1 Tax=Rossellomorea aquimaris TaxID=189382 RepID=UPI001CD47F90|nr:rhomboid family intramembrane serine protease [Rossellomorea aquimaris]MCA1054826.1 rhomboid family intramembrane serine protease [Rossellomorea aquimaris]
MRHPVNQWKVVDVVNLKYHYLFWKMTHYLIKHKRYRVLNLSREQDEIWLESTELKEPDIIRLRLKDLDWGGWVKRDIELTSQNAERIRKKRHKRRLKLKNLYISTYPPVDDEGNLFGVQATERERNVIESLLVDEAAGTETLNNDDLFSEGDWDLPEDVLEAHVEWMKNNALSASNEQLQTERKLFQRGKPLFTYLFMAIQVIMFLVLEMNGGSQNPQTLIEYGAKYNPLIIEGEWWRLVAPIFLHIGLLHLLMNTLALFYLGTAVEKIYGRTRFVLIYLLSGIAGSFASYLFTTNLSAGASGAIFGCFGALLYFGVLYPKIFFRTMGTNIIAVIILNLAFGFTIPGIDNAGHLGGLTGGFLAAGIVSVPGVLRPVRQLLVLLLSVLLVGAFYVNDQQASPSEWDVNTLNGVAQEKISNQEWEEAEKLLSDVVDNGSPNAETYFYLSYAEIKLGDSLQAKDNLITALDKRDDFHEAHYNLALLLADSGEYDDALIHAEKAYELNNQEEKYKELINQLKERN